MIIRIAFPLSLLVCLFTTVLAGLVAANESSMYEARYDRALDRLQKTPPEDTLLKVLQTKAGDLSEEERGLIARSVSRYSRIDGHDPYLLLALIEIESGFDRGAVSSVGAKGLMQIRPFVAQYLAEELSMSSKKAASLHDVDTNLQIGSYYLAKMIRRYGNLSLALEAYNLGPAKMDELRQGGELQWRFTSKVKMAMVRLKKLAIIEENA
ncbi:MAG: lytic transglycosylase domain-containing protein [Nitrospinae bacterium]|nr:lytic transglycosylase domain-containing protein [Nitrospinota bacterium]